MEDWPDVALGTLGLDARTAVITLSHDPKIDDPALQVALPSAAFYVGALGSIRTHAKRVARLEQAGLTARAIARLHAPVGLDIAARLPGEIAVSILAEVTQVLRRP
jgi:xanthine dehydrogenase accessory factor